MGWLSSPSSTLPSILSPSTVLSVYISLSIPMKLYIDNSVYRYVCIYILHVYKNHSLIHYLQCCNCCSTSISKWRVNDGIGPELVELRVSWLIHLSYNRRSMLLYLNFVLIGFNFLSYFNWLLYVLAGPFLQSNKLILHTMRLWGDFAFMVLRNSKIVS